MIAAASILLAALIVVFALRVRRARKARSAVASGAAVALASAQSVDLIGGRHRAPVRSSRWAGSRGSM
jgi:hypothetical protein